MIACNICDIKLFTKKLFIGETFDRFLLKEAEIVTFNTFSIDGRVHKSFYSEEERAEGQIEEYSTWKTLRPFCFSLIKGKKLPERFSIILKLPKAATEQFLTARKSQWLPEQVGGLFLNIHYENPAFKLCHAVAQPIYVRQDAGTRVGRVDPDIFAKRRAAV